MRLAKPMMVGMTHSIWSALAALICVPLYLRYLGIEAFGLIGLLTTFQSILFFLDFGISTTLIREVARLGTNNQSSSQLVCAALGLISLLGLAIILGMFASAPFITGSWLQSGLPSEEIVTALRLMGPIIAFRLCSVIASAAMHGAHQQTTVAIIGIAYVTASTVGAAVLLATTNSGTLEFLIWQAFWAAAQFLVLLLMLRQEMPEGARPSWSFRPLWQARELTVTMGMLGGGGLLFTQLDKLVLSHYVALSEFAQYSLVMLLANSLYLLVTPTFNALFPRLTVLANESSGDVSMLYSGATKWLGLLLLPIGAAGAALAEPLITLWSGDSALAHRCAPLLGPLLLGVAIHGLLHLPYCLQLAYGKARMALEINIGTALLMTPILLFAVTRWGGKGAAWTWLCVQIFGITVSATLVHRKLLGWKGVRRFVKDLLPSGCMAVILGGGLSMLNSVGLVGSALSLATCAGMVSLAMLVLFLATPELRTEAISMIRTEQRR